MAISAYPRLEIHAKFHPLLTEEHDIANLEGGRGGMKSEGVHRVVVYRMLDEPIRVFGCRETMASIKDSSHKTLADIIYYHGMARSQNGPFEVQESRIIRRDGDRVEAEAFFGGVRENIRDSKSLTNIDLTVFDEAGKATKEGIQVLEPTVLRKKGSKLWYMWNPEKVSDPIWEHLMLNPPPRTLHIHTTYLDNPWASEVMIRQAEHCRETEPDEYAHIWLGHPRDEMKGAIYQAEMRAVLEEGRITSIPYNKQRPVDTAWDLGMGDPTCIWFVQPYDGWWNFIDYLEVQNTYLTDILVMLQQKGYLYGTHYLPHDGSDGIIHRKFVAGRVLKNLDASPLTVLRNAGFHAEVTTKLLKGTTVDALRGILPRCRFDRLKCADGIDHLRFYQWDREADEVGKRKPLHDIHSHAPEAAQVAALKIKQPGAPITETSPYGTMPLVSGGAWS